MCIRDREILDSGGQGPRVDQLAPVVSPADVAMMSTAIESVHVSPELKGYLLDIAAATRNHASLRLGLSPRAVLSLQRVCRALAAASGRTFVIPDDVKALARPVTAHRLMLSPEAQLAGMTPASVVDEVLATVPVPAVR